MAGFVWGGHESNSSESGQLVTDHSIDQPSSAGDATAFSPPRGAGLHVILAAFIACFVAARAGLFLASVQGGVASVWPVSGVALVAALLGGPRVFPGILLGVGLAHFSISAPGWQAASLGVGQALEALAGAWMARWMARRLGGFPRAAQPVSLAVAAGLAPMLGATVAAGCGIAFGSQPGARESSWWAWWVGNSLGTLLVAPGLVTLLEGRMRGPWTAATV